MACMSSLEASASCTLLMICQLGRALLGLLEQALGLVEQAGIFERHAHAGGQRLSAGEHPIH